eukprot:TRINITY_DN11013_c0_g1_i1.p1 TRINITY_DN11013_c0_g1~~TRINITY_DN11013_c0_g1_i1.p1  ORF type:complete len:510 (-),score=127.28 TRINITY_DN11013_c0_g1_i1:325-1797(-)
MVNDFFGHGYSPSEIGDGAVGTARHAWSEEGDQLTELMEQERIASVHQIEGPEEEFNKVELIEMHDKSLQMQETVVTKEEVEEEVAQEAEVMQAAQKIHEGPEFPERTEIPTARVDEDEFPKIQDVPEIEEIQSIPDSQEIQEAEKGVEEVDEEKKVEEGDEQGASGAEADRLAGLRARLRELRSISAELDGLVHRGRLQAEWTRLAQQRTTAEMDIDLVCNVAARLRTTAPLRTVLGPEGWPSAPLPPNAGLPYPTFQDELPQATSLRSAASRAPPPDVSATKEPGGDVWEVRLRLFPPATEVLYTVDGSLPRFDNPSARRCKLRPNADLQQLSSGVRVRVRPGTRFFAAAAAKGLRISAYVTVTLPRSSTAARLATAPATTQPPPLSARSSPAQMPAMSTALTASAAAAPDTSATSPPQTVPESFGNCAAVGERSCAAASTLREAVGGVAPSTTKAAQAAEKPSQQRATARSQFKGFLLGAGGSDDSE